MTQWWEWLGWVVAILSGVGGLWLGIRAEMRNRYKKAWTLEIARGRVTFHNRTGEDANDVQLLLDPKLWQPVNYMPYSMVPANGSAGFALRPTAATRETPFTVGITWTRPSTSASYRKNFGTKRAGKPDTLAFDPYS